MALTPGTCLGPYEIAAPLGAGGMGAVYRARDTRLDRSVAIKVLADDLAGDPDFQTRFENEARAISQLTHPHICTLYDIAQHEGTTFLVMELLVGETLAERLARGTPERPALSLDVALQIAIQIADALAAAHQRGIVHRDLKPGNVMLTKAPGSSSVPHAKLLDFGLAKATPVVVTSPLSIAPTTPHAVTAQGTILGTIQYMAPEQIEGALVDARTDIFAFGSVLYEMVTGRKAFEGKSQAGLMAAILERDPPPVSALQPRAPALVDALVARCLAKSPDQRWQSAADLATALTWATQGWNAARSDEAEAAPATRRLGAYGRAALAIALAALLFAAGAVVAPRFRGGAPSTAITQRFEIQPPTDATWSPSPVSSTAQLALSPDGEHLAFVAARKHGMSQVWLRPLRAVDAQPLAGTEGAAFPFWSPDSRHIAFFADGKLKRIEAAGGRPQVVADAPAGRGGAWGPNGLIVFTPTPSQGLWSVSADGGAVSVVTSTVETKAVTHYWPQFLPDGRRVLFYQRTGDPEAQGIYIVDLASKAITKVMTHDGRATYAGSHLLMVRDGMLFAQPFDDRQMRLVGAPTRIADAVGFFGGTFGDASVTASNNGMLAHGPRIVLNTSLQWRDRSGVVLSQVTTAGAAYRSPILSPDAKTVSYSVVDPSRSDGPDIWMLELARRIPIRLTSDPRNDWFPVWSADGSRIYFGSTRHGSTGLFEKLPSASAPDEALTEPTQFGRYPTDVTRDGALIVYQEVARDGYDLGVIPTRGTRTARSILATRFNEVQPRLAPNQRWIAYASDESGRFEVYVRPFPEGARQWTISVAGGMQPRWRPDGKELFYLARDGKLMAVPVTTDGASFSVEAPHPLFDLEAPEPTAPFPTDYDVSGDGRRFLVNVIADQGIPPSVTVILNWLWELQNKE